jgi:hypothetical protein
MQVRVGIFNAGAKRLASRSVRIDRRTPGNLGRMELERNDGPSLAPFGAGLSDGTPNAG